MMTASEYPDQPKISCVMPTYGRPEYVNEAVWTFLQQDDLHKELIILNDCPGQTFAFDHPDVRIFNEPERFPTLGEKRNRSVDLADGDLIAVWDDDDVFLPWRLSFTRERLAASGTPFYLAAEFWAYWGQNWLHDNQAAAGWCYHPNTLFTKALWRSVGGYPHCGVGEDAQFFDRIHRLLPDTRTRRTIGRDDRFMILRGKSRYAHMCMGGGEKPLDVRPGRYEIEPKPIADPLLRSHYEDRIARRASRSSDDERIAASSPAEPVGRPALSICVSLKNRSRIVDGGDALTLFPNCVRSIAAAARRLREQENFGPVELIVADFRSDDWPVEEWIAEAAAGLAWKLLRIDGPFSKGRGLNRAVRRAAGRCVFLCDADLLVTPEVLRRAAAVADRGEAWAPIFRRLSRDGAPGAWGDFGYGPIAASREHYRQAGGVPEFESWGGEDDVFYARLRGVVPVVRERVAELRHQWHPERARHENYRSAPRSDYRDFCRTDRKNRSRGNEEEILCYGVHPDWTGELVLAGDGRFRKDGVGEGRYTLSPGSNLILEWDEGPRDALAWNAGRELFETSDAAFSVRRTSHAARPF